MAKQNKFVVNDESVKNTHGFYLLNSGGEFSRFEKNPVMLHNHDRDQLIGKWEDLKTEGDELTAIPIFDEGCDTGKEKKRQVDEGYLKGASPGIRIIDAEFRIINGRDELVVTRWELMEISVTPVPSGANSVRLYDENGSQLIGEEVRLFVEKFKSKQTDMEIKLIAPVLGLSSDTSESKVLDAVKKAVDDNKQYKIDLASKDEEIKNLRTKVEAAEKSKVKNLIDQAIREKKIDETLRGHYTKFAEADFEGCEKALSAMKGVDKVTSKIGEDAAGDIPEKEKGWTYTDYVKHNKAAELKANNFDRFKDLYKAEFGREYKG